MLVNLKIQKFENFDSLSENMDHRTVEAIVKYIKHPGIIVIASEFTKTFFYFNAITIEDGLKEISMLDT